MNAMERRRKETYIHLGGLAIVRRDREQKGREREMIGRYVTWLKSMPLVRRTVNSSPGDIKHPA